MRLFASGCPSRLQDVKSPSTRHLFERDAGRSGFAFVVRLVKASDFRTSEEPLGFFTPWRLSGLLSGYLPTDTRPQARAKLGKSANMSFDSVVQVFS